ncbi:MgtC/SapB family protein [Nostoc sphaeroides]|uniref:MgtC, putative Mg2+ transporter-C (MgtC) family protein n=1 Tax=Nostoc sphaeroides CCNUC1 TaxID=2653204 RepID=A0A5P8VTP2_9NOSO|nr:MgtC/SapB family protein [Nostoc sphaeroides]MCC5628473.1 MgtC/SapB family protein [Nostoc sphaeroides CHAB 2801]QFS43752.1 mgtC, putative Mg2+ transporter-C (MgtC) family protein [Nostoc sphaeroides CCNUC1]
MPNTYYLATNDWLNISFRLCLALFIGAIIGLERQIRRKPAGLRTHMLVSFGSAVFTLIIMQTDGSQSSRDALSRVIQGIAAGVGFLGAGEIVRQSSQESQRLEIHGLTSAAAIWVSAALGIAAGCGLWQLGLIAALLTFLVLTVFKRLEKRD